MTIDLRRMALAGLGLLLAACAPHIEAAGPPIVAPTLEADAVRTADDVALPVVRWPAEGDEIAVVLALHGFNDYSNAFDTPARFWAARGITTYAYDQRGFGDTAMRGLWAGGATMVDDLGTVARLIKAAHPDRPLYLVGESMGGAVIMAAMARPDPPPADGIVLVAPAVWGWQTMNPFYRASLWLSAHVMPWAEVSGRGLGIKPSDNRDMLIALSKDPKIIKRTRVDSVYGLVDLMDAAYDAAGDMADVPTLVLYGDNDELVPKAPTYDMLSRLAAPHRIAIYADGYHMLLRDLAADQPLTDIAAWIANPDAPLPSGAERDAGQILAGN